MAYRLSCCIGRQLSKGWGYKYEFVMDANANYGAIRRLKDKSVADIDGTQIYVLWDHVFEPAEDGKEQGEIMAWPVKDVVFEAAGDWAPEITAGKQNTRLPPYVFVKVTFLDSWGGTNFSLPMKFYFPVYQGE